MLTTEPPASLGQIELQPIRSTESAGPPRLAAEDANQLTGTGNKTIFKVLAASMGFFFAGNNDGSLGALTPYILRTYNVGTEYIALIYGAAFLGWLFAAATNSHMSRYLGLGMILTLGAAIQVAAHALRAWTPPFPLFVITFFIQAAGMAYNESHANSFVASLQNSHRPLGFIHAMYALGTLVSPFVATGIATATPTRWALFYIYLIGIGGINMLAVAVLFRDSLSMHASPTSGDGQQAAAPSRRKQANHDLVAALKSPPVYLLSMFYFFMLGAGITASGWVVEYLIEARNGKLPEVGYVPAALAGGIFLGRIVLAEPTYRFGERRMTLAYCVIMLALELVFWLVPNLISSAVTLCLLGFFFGPLFATGMSVGSKLFTKDEQPTALGLVFVLAQAGGSFFPAITGIVASRAGVRVMQPILVGLIVATGMSWVLVPKVKRRDV
ncbi:major facilitator superfamily domain-containing protein [Boeremia exigua]|uniref:major facilitator superfamily domain-containing protein n=1 Tax=Boeremia exigua TaxID=749465 RepID=UPI001E8E0463|nr:major facilitator superfamily domain-containing protein [Boeremia exigua]KAH6625299.1 major facilitator superfamily domain-containing protein [Boeremia exigua]